MWEALMYVIAGLVFVLIAAPWVLLVASPFITLGVIALSPSLILLNNALNRVRVLVADDDMVSIAPILLALKKCGRPVKTLVVKDGLEALTSLRDKKFDLLILDAMMPGLSGEEVLGAGDSISQSAGQIPVMFYTGEKEAVSSVQQQSYRHFRVVGVTPKSTQFSTLLKQVNQNVQAIA